MKLSTTLTCVNILGDNLYNQIDIPDGTGPV